LARVLFTAVAGCGNVSALGIKIRPASKKSCRAPAANARRKALRKAEGFTLHGGYCERARQSVVPQNSSHYVTTVQVYHA
jgi:hypothetical protein